MLKSIEKISEYVYKALKLVADHPKLVPVLYIFLSFVLVLLLYFLSTQLIKLNWRKRNKGLNFLSVKKLIIHESRKSLKLNNEINSELKLLRGYITGVTDQSKKMVEIIEKIKSDQK